MSQPVQSKYGSRCPNCHNPFTTPDALHRKLPAFAYPPVLTGCDVCHSLFKESNPVADSERT